MNLHGSGPESHRLLLAARPGRLIAFRNDQVAEREIHRVLWEGRVGDPHGASADPGLLEIEVDAVLGALAESRSHVPA